MKPQTLALTMRLAATLFPRCNCSLSTTLSGPIRARPISSLPSKPRTPLSLRPATHSATAADLKKWHKWAQTLAISAGPKFLNSDNGPDSTLLQRELKWLLQDALENPDLPLARVDKDDLVLPLRIGLGELYELWEQRIEKRRPFQYIVGCEHWRDLILSVEEGVLIPRPETELIVDLVEDLVKRNKEFGKGIWGDLGTGSGALAIGIGRILGNEARVIASDLSPIAVSVASYNTRRYYMQDKIQIRMGSWFEPLKDVEGELVGLVSNPPYIPTTNISGLQAEVAKHEPILALDGGANGMDDLLHICNGAASMLKPGGFFVFETNGETQCNFLMDYLRNGFEGRFSDIKIVLDFANKQRFVTGYRAR